MPRSAAKPPKGSNPATVADMLAQWRERSSADVREMAPRQRAPADDSAEPASYVVSQPVPPVVSRPQPPAVPQPAIPVPSAATPPGPAALPPARIDLRQVGAIGPRRDGGGPLPEAPDPGAPPASGGVLNRAAAGVSAVNRMGVYRRSDTAGGGRRDRRELVAPAPRLGWILATVAAVALAGTVVGHLRGPQAGTPAVVPGAANDMSRGSGATPAPRHTDPSATAPTAASAVSDVTTLAAAPGQFADDGTAGTAITYTLLGEANVTMTVLDSNGRTVAAVFSDDPEQPGNHVRHWYGYGAGGALLPAGSYRIVVTATTSDGRSTAALDVGLLG